MSINHDNIENTPINFDEKLTLPDISLRTTHKKKNITPGDPTLDTAHIHDDFEIYLHVSGSCSFFVNNSIYHLQRGDIILTRPGDVHFLIIDQASVNEHFCLWFAPACGKELFSFIESDFSPHVSFSPETQDTLIPLFFELAKHGTV